MRHKKIKVCFIALGAYPILSSNDLVENITGPDLHQVILAKELDNYDNYDITFINYVEGVGGFECLDNFQIIKINDPKFNTSRLNQIKNLMRAMRMADADIYFHHGGIFGVIAILSKLLGKKYIYHIGSDALVNPELINREINEFKLTKYGLTSLGNYIDIKLANEVIVQTDYQQKYLKKNYGRNGLIIKKPIDLDIQCPLPDESKNSIILWVGSLADVKQPKLFAKLAEKIPEAKFKMVGGNSGNMELYEEISRSSKNLSNFEFIGVVPFDEIDKYFSECSIVVNTSVFEAYPCYSQIQGWIYNKPVISLHDNEYDVINKNKMGFCSKTFGQLTKDLRILIQNKDLRKNMGSNGRKFVEDQHNIKIIIKKYIELFNSMVEQ